MSMEEPQWVLPQVVLAIHQQQLAEHGGTVGIRDQGLLASALDRPRNLFAYQPQFATIPRLAACYAHGLARNHPFVDGNKRVALVVSLLFLRLNRWELTASLEERYRVFMGLASGHMGEDELGGWFSENSREAG